MNARYNIIISFQLQNLGSTIATFYLLKQLFLKNGYDNPLLCTHFNSSLMSQIALT